MTTQTSRLSIVIDTGNAETTIRRLERSLSDLQRQGTNTANSLANLGRQSSLNGLLSGVARASGGMANLGSSVSRTAGIFSNYYNSLNRTTNNFNQFNNAINRTTNNITRMGDTINRNITVINNYNRSLSGTHDALSRLQGLLTGGMFGVFALSVAKTADSMQETHSQIKLVTKSHEEYLVVAERLHEMAGKNLKDFQATAGLYTNSARALGQLGKSQEEVLKFTNAVSLAMSVGGKSAQEQASALLQLGQAMQSGALQGDEFRSVAENAPILLDLIAEKLGKTRAEIKELGSDGKITSEVIHDALADATPKLQEMFDKMPVTMSQGLFVLKNEYKKFTHEFMNGEGGISSVVAKGLIGLSKHFDTLGKVAIAGAGVAMLGFASKVKITTTAFTVLGNVIKAHPVLAIATGILGVASAFYGLDDVLNTTGIIFKDLFGLVTTGLNGLSDLVEAVAFNIKDEFAKSNQETATGFGVFFADTEKGFTGLLHGISRIVASATGVLGGFFAWINTKTTNALLRVDNAFIGLGNSIGSVFANIANSIMDFLTLAVKKTNDMIGGLNQMLAKLPFGSFEIAPINFDFGGCFQYKPMPYKSLYTATLSQHIDDYVGMAVDIADSQVGGYLQSVKQRASTSNNLPVDLTVPSQAQTPSSSDKDKDKKGKKGKDDDFNNRPLSLSIYKAFIDEGATHNQALALTAEVGRENDFKASTVFGIHLDPAKDKNGKNIINHGMFSWNKGREKPLMDSLRQAGLIKNGQMVHSQETLRLQARHALREALEPDRQKHLKYFWDNPNADPETYAKGLGKGLLGWAYGQDTIRGKGGKRIPFDWKYQDRRRRNHLNNLVKMINSGGYDVSRSAKDDIKSFQDLQKSQQEIRSLFLSNKEIQAKEYSETVDKINEAFAGDDKTRIEYLGKLRILFNKTQDYQDALSAYELTGYRMSQKQRLQMEKQLALQKLEISTELDEQQKQHHRQAIVDKYNFDNEQFQKSQQENIAHFDSMIKSTLKMGYTATLTDMLNKRFLSKFDYEQWQLDQNIATQISDETKRYENLISSINQQDNTGNFVIDDAIERHRLLQEAEQSHLQEMTALRRIYAEQTRVLEQESLEHTLTAYGSVFSSLSGLVKNYSSEQSSAYRTMFAISKSFALAQAGIAVWSSASDAYAKEPGTVWQKMAAALKATIDQGKFVNLISAVSPRGFKTGGYTGNVGTSQIAGVVHGQEYVVNAKATKRIGVDNLNKLNSGGSLGGVNIVINNYTSEKASVEQMPNGDFMVTIGKMVKEMSRAEAKQVMYEESRQGGMLDRHYRR